MRADWVSPWWQAACLPPLWDVCGFTVPPLSVWHTFALENVGNAYLCGGTPSVDDAAALLLFVRHGMPGGQRLMLQQYWRGRQVSRVVRRLGRMIWRDVDAACREYVSNCTRAVSRWQKGGSGKQCAVPYQFHMVRRLCAEFGVSVEQAWDMPYALARCYYDAGAESAGDDSIMSIPAQEMEDNWADYAPQSQVAAAAEIGLN